MFKILLTTILFLALQTAANCTICGKTQEGSVKDTSSSSSDETSYDVISKEPCFDISQFQYNQNKKAELEKPVELECIVKNKGAYSVAWMYENQLISLDDKLIRPDANLKIDSDSNQKFNLKLTHVDSNNKGSYRCQISTLVAKNLEYNLDILLPPSITRVPSNDVIVLNEGESITVQCLTQGNPKPNLTWSKRGEKADHTTIDESKSTLNLQSVDASHSDSYSCTAKNDVGIPVTSEFQILVKFKPKLSVADDSNIVRNVLYSGNGKKETIKCLVDSYPMPKVSLSLNDKLISSDLYSFEEVKENSRKYELVYTFTSSPDTIGDYTCIVENELGQTRSQLKVTHSSNELVISTEKLPIYSDAIVFEWSALSGTPIQELNVQVFTEENLNGTSLVTKTKQTLSDGTELQPTYHNENVQYKDYYEVTKLKSNTTYTIRFRVKNSDSISTTNSPNEFSEWSQNITVRTHLEDGDKSVKHKSSIHHHRHHDRHHKQLMGAASLNNKRDRFNSYLSDSNSATTTTTTNMRLCLSFGFILINTILINFSF